MYLHADKDQTTTCILMAIYAVIHVIASLFYGDMNGVFLGALVFVVILIFVRPHDK